MSLARPRVGTAGCRFAALALAWSATWTCSVEAQPNTEPAPRPSQALRRPIRTPAGLDYNYFEGIGAPLYESPLRLTDENFRFEGRGAGFNASFALHPNVHFVARYFQAQVSADDVTFEIDPATGQTATANIGLRRKGFTLLPNFNYSISRRTDLILGVGLAYEDIRVRLRTRLQAAEATLERGVTNRWGVVGSAGVRSRVWRGLELFGGFEMSSVALLDNEIYLSAGTRYNFWDAIAVSAQVTAGTDSFIGIVFGLRLYFFEVFRHAEAAKGRERS